MEVLNSWMTVAEAAAWLGVHASAIRQAVQKGRIDAVKKGGIWLIGKEELRMYKVTRREWRK